MFVGIQPRAPKVLFDPQHTTSSGLLLADSLPENNPNINP